MPIAFYTYVIGELLVGILALIGNSLVIHVFCVHKRLRCFRNFYIIGLAVADCGIGCIGIPLAILARHGLPVDNLYGCLFTCSFIELCCAISVLCLLAVSIDRFWATFNPVSYYNHMSAKIVGGVLGLCVILGTLLGLLPLFGWNKGRINFRRGDACNFVQIMDDSYLVFIAFATIIFPGILMIGFYGYIYRFIRERNLQQVRKQSHASNAQLNQLHVEPDPASRDLDSKLTMSKAEAELNTERTKRKEARAGKKLSSIILFFLICWLPINLLNCVKAFCPGCWIPVELFDVTIILSHANSAVNPFLYAYHLKEFRVAMKNTLCSIVKVITFGKFNGSSNQPIPFSLTHSSVPQTLEH